MPLGPNITTKDEIKLASTSASTTYIRIPSNAAQKLEDVSIGDYAIAMGYINGSEVLETKRVILQSEAPKATKKTSVAGIISYIESDEGVIHKYNNQGGGRWELISVLQKLEKN